MIYNPYETITYVWAIRTLDPKSEKDKKSISHASAGYGYYILQPPEGMRKYFVVAYKHFGGMLPQGVQLATPYQAKQLETMDSHRYTRERDKANQTIGAV